MAVANDVLFAMLHSRGVSALAAVDLKSYETILLRGVGKQAHQIVIIGDHQILYLDSELPALKLIDLHTLKIFQLLDFKDDPKKFPKGLFVKSNIAYIGVTVAGNRAWRRDTDNDAQLIAFDLETFKIVWKRNLDSDGILNMISQPFLREDTGYVAVETKDVAPLGSMLISDELKVEQRKQAKDNSEGVLLAKLKKGLKSQTPSIWDSDAQSAKSKPETEVAESSQQIFDVNRPIVPKDPNTKAKIYDKAGMDHSEVTAENLIGGEWPSGLKFIDLRWKNMDKKADLSSKVDCAQDVQLIMGNTDGAYMAMKHMLLDLR